MDRKTVWRGTYFDVHPVEVAGIFATLPDGGLKEGHFDTELQAWAGILGENEQAVEVGVTRQQEALAEYVTARNDMFQRNIRRNKAIRSYTRWQRAHTAAHGAAV